MRNCGVLAASVFALLASLSANARSPNTLILRGASIYTLDAARPWASALVINDGRLVYVGDDAGTRPFAGGGARVIDLPGRMVLPGFHDAHMHPMTGGMRLLRCRLGGLASDREVYAAVRTCAAALHDGQWLLGSGWSPKAFAPGEPTLAKLDQLSADHPAFLTTEDGFIAWVNSPALAQAGIDGRTVAGVIDGDAAARVRRVIPVPGAAEYRAALRQSTAIANGFGITSVFDASASAGVVDAYRAADRAGELTVRVVAAQVVDPSRGEEQVDALIARRDHARGPRFRADAAKIFLDGEIDLHTAAMLEPYSAPAQGRGEMLIAPERLNAIVRRLDAAGFLVHMHAMGDGAVRAGLDAIDQSIRRNGPGDRRHQLAHIGVADAADLARFGRLGVTANLQPIWAQADDAASLPSQAALGPRRSRWMYPLASIAAAGGRIVAGSDWPSPSMNPLDGIQVGMTRQPLDGSKPAQQPAERASLPAMLAAYTANAAWVAREESIDGTIEAGKAADLVVLDRNLFAIPVTDIHQARVLLTLLDGEPVYRDPALPWSAP